MGDQIRIVKANSLRAYEKIKEERTIALMQNFQQKGYEPWNINSFFKGNIAEIRAVMLDMKIVALNTTMEKN